MDERKLITISYTAVNELSIPCNLSSHIVLTSKSEGNFSLGILSALPRCTGKALTIFTTDATGTAILAPGCLPIYRGRLRCAVKGELPIGLDCGEVPSKHNYLQGRRNIGSNVYTPRMRIDNRTVCSSKNMVNDRLFGHWLKARSKF